jgi:LSD1 subclass zinc finger protein
VQYETCHQVQCRVEMPCRSCRPLVMLQRGAPKCSIAVSARMPCHSRALLMVLQGGADLGWAASQHMLQRCCEAETELACQSWMLATRHSAQRTGL